MTEVRYNWTKEQIAEIYHTPLISVLPADKRTTVLGIMIRVVAIILTISQTDTRG